MKKSVAIIGGGPSALLAASFLDATKFDITIYDKKKSIGRKFLVAGDGGFNLTHGEIIEQMIARYTPSDFLEEALLNFTNKDLQNWLLKIGIPTFTGSSNRVYPEKGIKPIQVLNKIKDVLIKKNVLFKYNYEWKGWNNNNELIFNNSTTINTDYTIFSLGGSSWKITGSDGTWIDFFKNNGIKTNEFLPANCAYKINWNKEFIIANEGSPLKNIALSCLNKTQKGELVITKFGLEGNAIYALSSEIQPQLSNKKEATIYLDLKPMLNTDAVLKKLNSSNLKTTPTLKKVLKLSDAQIQLLKFHTTKEEYTNNNTLSQKIKALPLKVVAAANLDEAISTTGGIALQEVSNNFELKKLKNNFCIGEMLDWNAPTGGYLLQACFSMGVALAKYLNKQ
ncbi:MAG: NAD(P)/FAD-dependent oxidoreductase [Tenacibaculum sp.]